jgi:hypothetical protein
MIAALMCVAPDEAIMLAFSAEWYSRGQAMRT